jgi:hypothetical protein
MSVYRSLDREWDRISASPSATDQLAGWAGVEPVLAGYRTPRDVLAAIAAPDCAELAHELLRCLLRQAGDPLAARSFLQAVLPALRAARVWPPEQDHSADRVAATWEAIRMHAGESPQYPARFIVRIAERRLRTGREARRREAQRLAVLPPDPEGVGAAVELDDARTAAEQVAIRVRDAFRSGMLTAAQARLLFATAVVGLRASDAARVEGLRCRSVYRALDAAEAALIRVSA